MEGSKYVPLLACEKDIKPMFSSGGFLLGENTLNRVLPFTLIRLSMFFLISRTLRYLLKPLKQTKFICNLLTGIILGTSVLGVFKGYAAIKDVASQRHFLNFMSFNGLMYHIFLITVKIDGSMILKTRKKARLIGVLAPLSAFFVMALLNLILHPVTFKIHRDRYVVSFQVSCNSILNVAPTLEELHLLTTELGQVALSAALANDIFASVLQLFGVLHISFTNNFLKAVLPLGIVIALTLYVLRPIMQWVIRRTPKGKTVKETYVIGVLLAAGVISSLFDVIAGNPMLGVSFFGLVVPSGPPLGSAVIEMGEMFIENFLQPFFFLSVGDMINLHGIKDWKAHLMLQLIFIVGYLTRMLVAALLAMIYNMNHRQAITLGILMNSTGVIDTGLPWLSWLRQTWDMPFASLVVISSITKGALVSPLALYFSKYKSKSSDPSNRGFELSIQAASTSSKLRILACIDHEDDVPGMVTLLEASNPTESNPVHAYVIHLNELIGQAVPMLMSHKKHKRICKHNGCIQIMSALKNYCDNSEGKVVMQLLTMIAPFKSMHEGLCRLAQDKVIPLIIVPFRYKSPVLYIQQSASSDLNRKIQSQVPCTVGIFVDKGTNRIKHQNQHFFSYKVMVIFFGGEDDREALAYATRMSGHPGVSIIMLRIIVQDYQSDIDDDDRCLDEALVDKYKSKIIDNACAVCRETKVENWLEAIQVIKSLDNDSDLVIMGRRHGETNLEEQQMVVLTGAPELGFIGEMLASIEFQDQRRFSILVMQHCIGVDTDAIGNLMMLEDNDMC